MFLVLFSEKFLFVFLEVDRQPLEVGDLSPGEQLRLNNTTTSTIIAFTCVALFFQAPTSTHVYRRSKIVSTDYFVRQSARPFIRPLVRPT